MKDRELDYPTWVCLDCGLKLGKGRATKSCTTWHMAVCNVCGKKTAVTEPRDFGHLRSDWRVLRENDKGKRRSVAESA